MTTKTFNKVGKAIAKVLTIVSVFSFGGMVDNTIEYATTEGIVITVVLGLISIMGIGMEYIVNKMSKEDK